MSTRLFVLGVGVLLVAAFGLYVLRPVAHTATRAAHTAQNTARTVNDTARTVKHINATVNPDSADVQQTAAQWCHGKNNFTATKHSGGGYVIHFPTGTQRFSDASAAWEAFDSYCGQ